MRGELFVFTLFEVFHRVQIKANTLCLDNTTRNTLSAGGLLMGGQAWPTKTRLHD